MSDRQRTARASWLSSSTTSTTGAETRTRPAQVPPALRQARHSGLFQAVQQLDTAGLDEQVRHELAGWVTEQYAQTYGSIPVGFVAKCYLGAPYVDHFLNLMLSIVDHYAAADTMPSPFGEARMLARSTAYAFVEVHDNGLLVPVLPDGTPVI